MSVPSVSSEAIEVQGLNKWFGELHAVRDISLTVHRGDVLGFLGPNGAGKSTTMKMVTGFLEPSSGTVRIAGFDMLADPLPAKERIGYLPEGAPAYGEMTPLGFLGFIGEIRRLPRQRLAERIAAVVESIQLGGVLHQPIETLSKGYKRRVGIAQALLHDPEILVLDEPTDGLDPNQKHEIRTLIRRMAPDKAIVVSTHILEEVNAVCNRAIIIADGTVVFAGSPSSLAARSRYYNAVCLTLDDQHLADAESRIGAVAGVAGFEREPAVPGFTRLVVLAQPGAGLIRPIGDLIHARDWEVRELHVDGGRLDEVFRRITLGGPDGAPGAAPGAAPTASAPTAAAPTGPSPGPSGPSPGAPTAAGSAGGTP
jgi:ABC-2 type transport system ATP-binding protein